ncbi:hypothetical protein A6V39_04840 [Candidatus Mycoplasma haematobovis]|uniref:Uncharacterized protein n=1 Tax=Candidatus Mycoplasma haematobovis TaxID=432608 RepID=A0A1A9QBB1_9MOLU|nr:hypothetical protein [Candidatus Mycoplasma haematobovis]OAL09872.1 hypothetical protein A6V39_04840 [Candidatus Mycoplasma haematobovis]
MYARAYVRLFKYLDQLVLGRKFFASESTRAALKDAIESSFSLLIWIANKSNKSSSEVYALFDKYKENYFANEAKIVNEKYEINSDEELNDYVNYLRICVQNVCDLDLDNLSEEELAKEPYEEKPNATVVYKNFFNTLDVNAPVGKVVDDLILRSHAWERLKEDIRSGAIYIYKTKPKRNVIIKIILSYLLFFGAITALTLLVSCALTGAQDKAQLIIVSSLAVIYFLFGLHYSRKTFANDNLKYSFQRTEFYYTFFFSLFFTFALSTNSEGGVGSQIITKNLDGWNKGLWIGLITIIILIGLIYLVSYLYFQPEEDKKLMESTLEKHLADISKTSTLNS